MIGPRVESSNVTVPHQLSRGARGKGQGVLLGLACTYVGRAVCSIVDRTLTSVSNGQLLECNIKDFIILQGGAKSEYTELSYSLIIHRT